VRGFGEIGWAKAPRPQAYRNGSSNVVGLRELALENRGRFMPLPPHPANVPGDFYVEDGCCTLCDVPFSEAPELFAYWPNADMPQHCFVKRQPQSAAELDRMVMVIQCAELQCIHYRGHDRTIQMRLLQIGEGLACDNLPSELREIAEAMEGNSPRLALKQQTLRLSILDQIREWWHRWF